jgi:hypothetical protein
LSTGNIFGLRLVLIRGINGYGHGGEMAEPKTTKNDQSVDDFISGMPTGEKAMRLSLVFHLGNRL